MTQNVTNKAHRSLLQRYAAAPHIVWSILFIIVPLIFIAYYAFTDVSTGALTMSNISAFFTKDYLLIFWKSVKLAIIAKIRPKIAPATASIPALSIKFVAHK